MTSHVEVAADLRHAPRASGPLGDQGGDCGRRSSGWRGGGGDRPCGLGALFEARRTAAPTRLPQCSRNVWLPAFADPYSGAALRILLLEDEPEMVSALRTALRRYDPIVDHVATLAEAEEALAIGAYGAVLLDRQVPDGDGLSLIRKLRARSWRSHHRAHRPRRCRRAHQRPRHRRRRLPRQTLCHGRTPRA